MDRGLASEFDWRMTALTSTTIAVSIILHGITVTSLMNWYQRRRRRNPTGA